MSITDYSNVIYDENGRRRHVENWRVYALFCMRDAEHALVKIGISSIVYDRMVSLLPGLPYPITEVRHIAVGDRRDAANFEASLHRFFKTKRTRGEWFEFNVKDAKDKMLFNSAFASVWAAVMPLHSGLMKWERITGAQIRAYRAMRTEERKAKRELRRKSWSGSCA